MITSTANAECTPANCGCKARTDEQVLIGALVATGRAKDRTDAELDAKALLWALREYGWSVTRDA